MPVSNYYEWDAFAWDTFPWDGDVVGDGWSLSTTGSGSWSLVTGPSTNWS